MTDWLKNWARSPRQDRRTVIDGKFVELAPLTRVEQNIEQESALDFIETAPIPVVLPDTYSAPKEDTDAAFKSLSSEEIEAKGLTVLSSPSEGPAGSDVLDGQAGRTESSESEKLQEELEPLPEREDYPF